jgi:hypothetical protein
MAKHCIFEHFLRFVKQIRPKPSVVVTLQRTVDTTSQPKADSKPDFRWSLSVGISRSSGIFFKPQKSIILKGFSADSNKPIKTHCPSSFQQIRTTSVKSGFHTQSCCRPEV